jgi:hypothetical protein
MSNETENTAEITRNANGQQVTNTYKYGTKLDGTPKNKPGRKATGKVNKTKIIFVHDGKVVTRGKPSLEQVKHRRQVVVPAGVTYDPTVHGVGVRLPEDDQRAKDMELTIANRELARKAAKGVSVTQPSEVASIPTTNPEATPTTPNNEVVATPANNDTVSL